MKNSFVSLEQLGSGAPVAVSPAHVASAQEFDSGRGGIGTALKMASGDTINVRGPLQDVLAKLTAE